MKKFKEYTPSEYARLKGVSPARITALKNKLAKKEFAGKWFPIDCPFNDNFFEKPKNRASDR